MSKYLTSKDMDDILCTNTVECQILTNKTTPKCTLSINIFTHGENSLSCQLTNFLIVEDF